MILIIWLGLVSQFSGISSGSVGRFRLDRSIGAECPHREERQAGSDPP